MRRFTWAEVKYNKFIVINNKVYDPTNFLDKHPGGRDIIEEWIGKDATQAFLSVGHSGSAIKEMEKLYVGEVDLLSEKPKDGHMSLYFCIGLLVGVSGFIIYLIIK